MSAIEWTETTSDGLRICVERDAATAKRKEAEEVGQLDLLGGLV